MLVLDAATVARLMPMKQAVEVMRQAYTDSLADVQVIPRLITETREPLGYFAAMPAYHQVKGHYIVKVAGLTVAANRQCTMDALVALMDTRRACFLALIDGNSLTQIRTAACAALVTDLLAPANAERLCIVGTGHIAAGLLHAHCAVRDIRTVSVYSRQRDNIFRFIAQQQPLLASTVQLQAAPSLDAALQEAEIICTATSAEQALIDTHNLPAHCHIAAVGNHSSNHCEVSSAVLETAQLIIEDPQAAEQAVPEQLRRGVEIHRLLSDAAVLDTLRTGPRSVYVSVGSAFQDLSLASALVQAAQWQGVGTSIQLH